MKQSKPSLPEFNKVTNTTKYRLKARRQQILMVQHVYANACLEISNQRHLNGFYVQTLGSDQVQEDNSSLNVKIVRKSKPNNQSANI